VDAWIREWSGRYRMSRPQRSKFKLNHWIDFVRSFIVVLRSESSSAMWCGNWRVEMEGTLVRALGHLSGRKSAPQGATLKTPEVSHDRLQMKSCTPYWSENWRGLQLCQTKRTSGDSGICIKCRSKTARDFWCFVVVGYPKSARLNMD
jgi:hypothetical protein